MASSDPTDVDPFRQKIRHPQLVRLYDYWASRRRGRRFPARADIDPVELKFALGNICLIDVLGTPLGFRWRLMGSLMAQRLGQDLTGQMVENYPDAAYRDYLIASFRAVIDTGRPAAIIHERMINGKPRRFEVIRLPLAEDGETINMLLLCPMYFEPLPEIRTLGTFSEGGPPHFIDPS